MVEKKLPVPAAATDAFGNDTPSTFGDKDPLQIHTADMDLTAESSLHTLGKGPTQAATGNHKHTANDIQGGVGIEDHGLLEGLSDDDHTQYPLANGTRASGTWPIGITGNAGSVDGQNFGWSNPGTWPTYFWGVNTNGAAGFLVAGSRVPRVYTGSTTPSGQKTGDIWAY